MSEYTVRRIRQCVVIEGSVPVDEFCALVDVWNRRGDDDMIVDALLAAELRVNFVIGPKKACNDWRAMLGIDAAGRQQHEV